ncbi:MAG TPA: DUF6658 family protein [Coleofasciculaceae cyanobacterium]
MKKLSVLFKQLRLRQLLTAFLAIGVLFVSTACNSGNVQGARPNNPPVQAGGANNPYKSGGDTNTKYNFSADSKLKSEAPISNQLVAVSDKAQYPGGNELQGRPADTQKDLPIIDMQDFETPEPGGQIQRESNVGNRIQDRFSRVKEQFDEASEFISDDAEEARERHQAVPKPGLD